jgi:hypothetical protein
MTEVEWLACESMCDLYDFTQPLLSDRKAFLFAAGCVRLTPLDAPHSLLERAADVVERVADGECDPDEALSINVEASELCTKVVLDSHDHYKALAALRLTETSASSYVWQTALFLQKALEGLPGSPMGSQDAACLHASLLRDVVLQPYRGIRGQRITRKRRVTKLLILKREWRSSTVIALAEGIYQDRDFSAMPILADALQDAGCDNPEILDHCRESGEHVRGCWVVDLILGKH